VRGRVPTETAAIRGAKAKQLLKQQTFAFGDQSSWWWAGGSVKTLIDYRAKEHSKWSYVEMYQDCHWGVWQVMT
jgi:hypothetical protein